jgi:hypothetical protein
MWLHMYLHREVLGLLRQPGARKATAYVSRFVQAEVELLTTRTVLFYTQIML